MTSITRLDATMAATVATRPKAHSEAALAASGYRSADELREVLDRTLEAVDKSKTAGATLRAAGLSMRVEVRDLKTVVTLSASDDPEHHITWRFDRRGRQKPRFVLTMDSETANAWLQGKESVPMAIARRRMKCSGDARDALRYLPALKVVSKRYRRLVRSDYSHLAI